MCGLAVLQKGCCTFADMYTRRWGLPGLKACRWDFACLQACRLAAGENLQTHRIGRLWVKPCSFADETLLVCMLGSLKICRKILEFSHISRLAGDTFVFLLQFVLCSLYLKMLQSKYEVVRSHFGADVYNLLLPVQRLV